MIGTSCQDVRRALEAEGGQEDGIRAHLRECPACQRHAALLATLAALPPADADETRVAEILAALPPAPWQRRRLATWLPLAAALALLGVGLALLGGVPAPGAVTALPHAAGGLGSWLGAWGLDVLAALRASADAARALLATGGLVAVGWLLLLAVGGGLGVTALVRRQRESGR